MRPRFALLFAFLFPVCLLYGNNQQGNAAPAHNSLIAVLQPAEAQKAPTTPIHAPGSSSDTAQIDIICPPTPASAALTQVFAKYRANSASESFSPVAQAFKSFIAPHGKTPMSALLKSNPTLIEMGARAIDAGTGRVWTFHKVPEAHIAIVQWADTKATVTFVGRRHRIKKVTYTSIWHTQEINLPSTVTLKDARVVGSFLVLVGEEHGSTLWLQALRSTDATWVESPGHFDSIPAFLRNNVSGKIAFRGSDLVFSVARVVASRAEGGLAAATLPEAESSTYKFLLHLTENGYVLDPHLPDETHFAVVHQLLAALTAGHTDVAKSLLIDSRLVSIPRYIGILSKPTSHFHVIEMANPVSSATRFRLITGGKDDLIFDTGKYKDKSVVKAIFIAPPDKFLSEIARLLIPYDHLVVSTAPVETTPQPEVQKQKAPH